MLNHPSGPQHRSGLMPAHHRPAHPGRWRRTAAGALATALLGLSGAGASLSAWAQPSSDSPDAVADFTACMAGSGRADVLVVMDQSGSLVDSYGGLPAMDPQHRRVDAAQDFVTELARFGEDTQTDIRVRTAGFGAAYYADPENYGSWNSLVTDSNAAIAQLEKFRDRTVDQWTQYPDAFHGALTTIASSDAPCQAILLFTDGVLTMADGNPEAAREQMCSATGPVAQLRATGTHIFTVGLTADGQQDMSLLRNISESDSGCGAGQPANGRFFEGADAAGLMAAFRSALPAGGSYSRTQIPMTDFFEFVLDNSVDPVRLSAQPEKSISEGNIIPVLRAPSGQSVDLLPGTTTIDGHQLNIAASEVVPGMVDVTMIRAGEWAGPWAFGYRSEGADSVSYRAQISIKPGMKLAVSSGDGENSNGDTALSSLNTSPLDIELRDAQGQPVVLDGQARLSAYFEDAQGATIPLAQDLPIGTGQAVPLSLEQITSPSSGTLKLRADITTADFDGRPGTVLEPVVLAAPLAVTVDNLPVLPGEVNLGQISALTDHEVLIPVQGPGRVWVESTQLAQAQLPPGAEVSLSSVHNSPETALELERGQTANLPVVIHPAALADGQLRAGIDLNFAQLDGSQAAAVTIPARGAMTAPVDQGIFWAVFVAVLLLAIIIPLAILYAMKVYAGRFPARLRVKTAAIDIAVDGSSVVRADTGAPLDFNQADHVAATETSLTGAAATVHGYQISRKANLNILSPAVMVVDKPDTVSIADNGQQYGSSAQFPPALVNRWFLALDSRRPTVATVVIIADTSGDAATLSALVADIRRQVPVHLPQLTQSLAAVAPTADAADSNTAESSNPWSSSSSASGQSTGGTENPWSTPSSGPGQSTGSTDNPWGSPPSSGESHPWTRS